MYMYAFNVGPRQLYAFLRWNTKPIAVELATAAEIELAVELATAAEIELAVELL